MKAVGGKFTPNKEVDKIPWPAWDLFKVHTYTEQGYVCGVNAGGS